MRVSQEVAQQISRQLHVITALLAVVIILLLYLLLFGTFSTRGAATSSDWETTSVEQLPSVESGQPYDDAPQSGAKVPDLPGQWKVSPGGTGAQIDSYLVLPASLGSRG